MLAFGSCQLGAALYKRLKKTLGDNKWLCINYLRLFFILLIYLQMCLSCSWRYISWHIVLFLFLQSCHYLLFRGLSGLQWYYVLFFRVAPLSWRLTDERVAYGYAFGMDDVFCYYYVLISCKCFVFHTSWSFARDGRNQSELKTWNQINHFTSKKRLPAGCCNCVCLNDSIGIFQDGQSIGHSRCSM